MNIPIAHTNLNPQALGKDDRHPGNRNPNSIRDCSNRQPPGNKPSTRVVCARPKVGTFVITFPTVGITLNKSLVGKHSQYRTGYSQKAYQAGQAHRKRGESLLAFPRHFGDGLRHRGDITDGLGTK